VLDNAHAEPERLVHGPHPLRVALGQIIVDGDDVDAAPGQRVEIGGERRHQRLAFARRHLGDLALVQHHAADELDVEVTHAERAPGRLPADGERRGEDVVDVGAVLETLAELRGLRPERRVVQCFELRLERVDGHDVRLKPLDVTLVFRPEDLTEEGIQHALTIIQAGVFGPATCRRAAPGRGDARCR